MRMHRAHLSVTLYWFVDILPPFSGTNVVGTTWNTNPMQRFSREFTWKYCHKLCSYAAKLQCASIFWPKPCQNWRRGAQADRESRGMAGFSGLKKWHPSSSHVEKTSPWESIGALLLLARHETHLHNSLTIPTPNQKYLQTLETILPASLLGAHVRYTPWKTHLLIARANNANKIVTS